MKTIESTTPQAVIERLGITLESSSPLGGVDGDWPHISYQCRIVRNGREFWSGPYKLGVVHVKIPTIQQGLPISGGVQFTQDECYCWNVLKLRPHSDIKDKALQASLCAKLAIAQKVTPKLPDVLHSLLLDGAAVDQTFEDWCAELGYSDDSIKARDTFEQCERIGKALARAFTRAELDELREAFREY